MVPSEKRNWNSSWLSMSSIMGILIPLILFGCLISITWIVVLKGSINPPTENVHWKDSIVYQKANISWLSGSEIYENPNGEQKHPSEIHIVADIGLSEPLELLLLLNMDLLEPTFSRMSFDDDHSHTMANVSEIEHCYYSGHIVGKPESTVTAWTCLNGLRVRTNRPINVVIYPEKNKTRGHVIEAFLEQDSWRHVTYRIEDDPGRSKKGCPHPHNDESEQYENDPVFDIIEGLKSHVKERRGSSENILTMTLVTDVEFNIRYGAQASQKAMAAANLASVLFRNGPFSPRLKLRVDRLIEYKTRNPFPVDKDAAKYLRSLCSWRSKEPELNKGAVTHVFTAIGLTWKGINGVVGYAFVGGTCTSSRGCGVNEFLYSDVVVAETLAHEIGHNMGARHDSEPGYIMQAVSSAHQRRTEWSTQSINSINTYMSLPKASCLRSSSTPALPPIPKVNGGWGHWSSWSSCSRTCDTGTKSRSRRCDSPKPSNGGVNCIGASSEQSTCFLKDCPDVVPPPPSPPKGPSTPEQEGTCELLPTGDWSVIDSSPLSSFGTYRRPSYTIDGKAYTWWMSGENINQWITFDAGRELIITSIEIRPVLYRCKFIRWEIATSLTSETWITTISGDVDINAVTKISGNANEYTSRYYRLFVVNSHNEDLIGIRELNVFHCVSSSTPPFTPTAPPATDWLDLRDAEITLSSMEGNQILGAIVDGNINTWVKFGSSSNEWMIFDLGSIYSLSQVRITPKKRRVKNVVVSLATSAHGDWILGAKGKVPENQSLTLALVNKNKSRFIQIWVEDTYGGNAYVGVAEVEMRS